MTDSSAKRAIKLRTQATAADSSDAITKKDLLILAESIEAIKTAYDSRINELNAKLESATSALKRLNGALAYVLVDDVSSSKERINILCSMAIHGSSSTSLPREVNMDNIEDLISTLSSTTDDEYEEFAQELRLPRTRRRRGSAPDDL